MSCVSGSYTIPVAVFLAVLLIAIPVGAYNVALYGSNSGFDPDLHKDSVVVQSIPGSAGASLDSNVNQFIQPSVDVIILSGGDSFSPSTAAKIEAAVAEGKILIITYPCNSLFDASLPASNGGSAPGGQFLEVADPTAASTEIFAGLPGHFSLQGKVPDKEQAVARNGSATLLNYDTGMPALLYGKYGKGYVIEWTTTSTPSYMNGGVADTILTRLIARLLPAPVVTPTTIVTTPSAIVTPQITTVVATSLPVTSVITSVPTPFVSEALLTTGTVAVYSSPIGASILIDGEYLGTTPANLTGIRQGNHILRLTQSGYYDYEGNIYVIPDETAHAFGTLPPLSQVQPAPTSVSIILPVVTAETTPVKGPLENTNVVVAIIGVVTAMIAAGATIFSQIMKVKKE